MKEKYLAAQKAWVALVDLKVGDKVKLNRVATTHELGWDAYWVSDMDKALGQEVEFMGIENANGIQLRFMNGSSEDSARFPFFILDKIIPKLPDPIKISSEYSIEFRDDKSIEVGCQKIPFTLLEKIYETAKSVKS